MRAAIICGGEVGEYIKNYVKEDDFVICADSGCDRAQKYGIVPDIVIGDMDSIENIGFATKKIVYPTRKDFTDSELAVDYALENGFDELLLFGMIGTRMDHTLTNISLLMRAENAAIIDGNNEIRLVKDEITLSGKVGDLISVIPLFSDAENITTRNLDYPLVNGGIKQGTSLGVSNVMTADECTIKIEKGSALVIRSRD